MITGRGTVIVGRVLIGTFSIGDVADIILDTDVTITDVELECCIIHDSAQTGDCVIMFLRGVKKDDIIGAKVLVNQGAKVLHKTCIPKFIY